MPCKVSRGPWPIEGDEVDVDAPGAAQLGDGCGADDTIRAGYFVCDSCVLGLASGLPQAWRTWCHP